jgi:hypothetical protein
MRKASGIGREESLEELLSYAEIKPSPSCAHPEMSVRTPARLGVAYLVKKTEVDRLELNEAQLRSTERKEDMRRLGLAFRVR